MEIGVDLSEGMRSLGCVKSVMRYVCMIWMLGRLGQGVRAQLYLE